MHGNRRYVKSTWICAVAVLVFASPARAEVVVRAAEQAELAVTADGRPYVAYTSGRNLFGAARSASGRWTRTRLGRLPGADVTLAGAQAVAGERGSEPAVLAEDGEGRWLALVLGKRITTIARAARGSSYGPAGLTLDAHGRPAIAYAVLRFSGKTFLRLVTFDRRGRRTTRAITQKGFPASDLPPGAAPVLVGGRLHVVETYTSAAIDWAPAPHGGWEGQYLFVSRLGSPQGRVEAAYLPSTLWSAWTQTYPAQPPGDLAVLLSASGETQTTWTLTHGIFVSIARGEAAPEVGAYDWATLGGDWRVYAGLLLQGPGGPSWQLDGRLEGLAIDRTGARQLLLSRAGVLEWFSSAPSGLPPIHIGMGMNAAGRLDGTVPGVTSGSVELYLELPHAPRELVANLQIQPDSSFAADGLDPASLYRAVYVDPASGIPFALLQGITAGSAPG